MFKKNIIFINHSFAILNKKIRIETQSIFISFMTVFLVVGLFLFSAISDVLATSVAIIKPVSYERLTGTVNIMFSVFYTGEHLPTYEIRLKNDSCGNAGTSLTGISPLPHVKNGYYNFSWATKNIPDGRYCLQICAQLPDATTCNVKLVDVVNYSNQPPKITSYPSKLNYTPNQVLKYQIQAFDPEGGNLIYKIINGPANLYLDGSGLLTLGNYFEPGNYDITVAVIDPDGGADYQSFRITVAKPTPTAVPSRKPTPTPTPTTSSSSLKISFPQDGDILKGATNEISWEIKDIDSSKIGKIIIEYSGTDGKAREIYTTDDPSVDSYNWDVSDLSEGDYKVRIKVLDKDGKFLAESVSDTFKISNISGEEDILVITDLQPANQAEIKERKPVISATYSPSAGSEITKDKVSVKIDGKDIKKNCSINTDGLRCELDTDLSYAEHTVEVYVEDSNSQTSQRSWVFTVIETKSASVAKTPEATATPFQFPVLNMDDPNFRWILLCCGVGIIVLLIFFVAKSISKKKLYMM